MKVIISAYSCETGRGSEGEIGWRIVNALAEKHDVRVITRANLRSVHQASFSETQKPAGLRFEYFDLPWIFRFYKKEKRFFLIYYYLWQVGVAFRARRMQRYERADILHHLIGGMDWMPSGLALCPGPLIWGPVGSENTHPMMLRHLTASSRLKEAARVGIRWLLRTMEPFTRFTGARASVVLSHTPDNMPARYYDRIRSFTQTGIVDLPSLARPKSDLSRKKRLRIVYAGELKDWKGAKIALSAALLFFETGVEADLVVLGDGPLRHEMLVIKQGHPNGGQVQFLGKVPMERLVDELHKGDVFLYPSFHHGLATVVLQAMLTGIPVVCVEGDGTGRAVGQRAGITVSLSDKEAPYVGLARALSTLAKDEDFRQTLGRAARRIALEEYSYEALAGLMEETYRDVLRGRSGGSDPTSEGDK